MSALIARLFLMGLQIQVTRDTTVRWPMGMFILPLAGAIWKLDFRVHLSKY